MHNGALSGTFVISFASLMLHSVALLDDLDGIPIIFISLILAQSRYGPNKDRE